jgi:hypothetical protein
MSSIEQATSSSTSNSQLIIDALADYTNITGIDLSKNSFAAELELSNSPQDILQLLQEREKAFEEYRDGNQRLIDCLSSTVRDTWRGGRGPGERTDTCHLMNLLT